MNNHKVSIIMPICNTQYHWELFKKAFVRAVKQTYNNTEVIVLCDGGKELDIKEAIRFKGMFNAEQKSKVLIFKSTTQLGPEIAKNYACKLASGKYLVFHDSDDEAMPNKVEKLINAIGDDYIISSHIREDGNRQRLVKQEDKCVQLLLEHKKLKSPFHWGSICIEKDMFEYFGGFESKYSDFVLASKIRLFRHLIGDGPIKVVPEVLYIYYRRYASVTSLKEANYESKKHRARICKGIRNNILDNMNKELTKDEIKQILCIEDNLSKCNLKSIEFIG